MAIKIIDEPDVHLTRAEYDRLKYEYSKAFEFYAGPVPSFEAWIYSRQNPAKTSCEFIIDCAPTSTGGE